MKRTALDNWICRVEGVPQIDRETLEAMQLARLNALLERERARGGFYADLPGRLGSLAELRTLPFTTPEQLSENAPAMLLGSQAGVRRIITGSTSGTSGLTKRVFYTARDLEHTVGFFAAGISEFTSPGDAVLVAMPFSGADGLGELICRAVGSLGARSVPAGAGRSLGELDALLDAEEPACYIGMSVPLLGLLRWRRLSGRPLVIKRALVSGDACPARVCAEIEALLGTELFPHYGSREMCLGGAVTCPAHEGMHLRENHVLAEIVDELGEPVPEGAPGELVITTLDMEALPLIRYRTGDITRFLPSCPCGGATRRIDRVSRADNAMEALDDALFSVQGLVDCSVRRTRLGLEIEAAGECSPRELAAAAHTLPELVRVVEPKPELRPMYAAKRVLL